jgi:hypothetical protein
MYGLFHECKFLTIEKKIKKKVMAPAYDARYSSSFPAAASDPSPF